MGGQPVFIAQRRAVQNSDQLFQQRPTVQKRKYVVAQMDNDAARFAARLLSRADQDVDVNDRVDHDGSPQWRRRRQFPPLLL